MSFLFFCILPSVISYIYAASYCMLRDPDRWDRDRKSILVKAGLCLIFNNMMFFIVPKNQEISCMLQLALLEVLSGIDIYICRIPTELLAAAGVLSVMIITQTHRSVLFVLSAVLTGAAFNLFRKRIGIGSYDILLTVALGAALLSIPLVPLITFSYYAIQNFL